MRIPRRAAAAIAATTAVGVARTTAQGHAMTMSVITRFISPSENHQVSAASMRIVGV